MKSGVMGCVWLVHKVNRFLERAIIWTTMMNESSFRHNKIFKSYLLPHEHRAITVSISMLPQFEKD